MGVEGICVCFISDVYCVKHMHFGHDGSSNWNAHSMILFVLLAHRVRSRFLQLRRYSYLLTYLLALKSKSHHFT